MTYRMIRRFNRVILCICLILPLGTILSAMEKPSSFVWLEKPAKTDFNTQAAWPELSEGRAPAVMPAGHNKPKNQSYASYSFKIHSPGGEMVLWGRNFDPKWSSTARWRIDDGEWNNWEPEPYVDRVVASKYFPIQWHKWGVVNIKPGSHSLTVEILGKRAKGDYPYFVMDAFLLAKGNYTPSKTQKPDEVVEKWIKIIESHTSTLPQAQARDIMNEVNEVAEKALKSDLGAIEEFKTILANVNEKVELNKMLQENKVRYLSGRVESIDLVNGKTVQLKTIWSGSFQGDVWIGFSQKQALYASLVKTVASGRIHTFTFNLPDNLPAGDILITCFPVGQPLAVGPSAYLTVPDECVDKKAVPASWGIYKETNGKIHPWYITENNMMIWDGKPYIPMGGMMNIRSTWQSYAGDKPNAQAIKSGNILLKKRLELLAQNGIKDVFFNACFIRSSPDAFAEMINISEEYGIRYGIHVSSKPEKTSLGFMRKNKFQQKINSSESSAVISLEVSAKKILPEKIRCLWGLTSEDGKLHEHGMVLMNKGEIVQKGKKRILTAEIKFNGFQQNGTLLYMPEIPLDSEDPTGYYAGIDDYEAKILDVYSNLPFGPGLRLWLDPFQNEMHYGAISVCTDPQFIKEYSLWLFKKYGTIEKLNQRWKIVSDDIQLSFDKAARLIPLYNNGVIAFWVDPSDNSVIKVAMESTESLRDLAEYKGTVCEAFISRIADTLKSIADVPVILKHNTWVSDWFVNPRKAGGQDGIGYEPYCYGDSLAYHNSLAAYAEVMTSARNQWALVTETSPAAFDGQKNYVGYIDRIQMLYDFDQLLKFGAKGIYTFGFSFDPPSLFQVTELIRDTRQLEWISTYSETLNAAAEKLAAYKPELYGWYPAHLREQQIIGNIPRKYEMDGHYTGVATQIRMAPDGRWIVPALRADAPWYGLLANKDLMTSGQSMTIAEIIRTKEPKVSIIGSTSDSFSLNGPVNGFTVNGIGVLPDTPRNMTLDEFREKVLGYRVFQTAEINGQTLPDGRLMIWTCIERQSATIKLPVNAKAVSLKGKEITLKPFSKKNVAITLERPTYEKSTENRPGYLGYGYYYPDKGQPEVALISNVTVDEILKMNAPVFHRWLPDGINPKRVKIWKEAEDFNECTFTQPLIEGYSRYSNGSGVGINTDYLPPEGKTWSVKYDFITSDINKSRFWLRRMSHPSLDLEIRVDGKLVGTFSAADTPSDLIELTPWNAGTGKNKVKVGWLSLPMGLISAGKHQVEITAIPDIKHSSGDIDIKLLGPEAEKHRNQELKKERHQQCVQIDAWAITQDN